MPKTGTLIGNSTGPAVRGRTSEYAQISRALSGNQMGSLTGHYLSFGDVRQPPTVVSSADTKPQTFAIGLFTHVKDIAAPDGQRLGTPCRGFDVTLQE